MNDQNHTQPITITTTEPATCPATLELPVKQPLSSIAPLPKDDPYAIALLAKADQLPLPAPIPLNSQLALAGAPNSQAPNSQLSTLSSQLPPAPHKHRRNGRIACLPRIQRDMVNRMLWNNVPYKNIVAALSESDFTVTEKNISNWAIGGYVDWRLEQEQILQNRLEQDHLVDYLRRDDAQELPEVGLQAAATRISQVMVQKLNQGADIEAELPRYSKMVELLCRLKREIADTQIQRDDSRRTLGKAHDPVRIKEVEEMSALDHERHYSNPPADSSLAKPPEPPVLPPLPTSEFLAQCDREEQEGKRFQNMKNTLEMVRIFSGKPKGGANGSTPSDANRIN